MSLGNKILTAIFNSVTARTAGFSTTDPGRLSDASKMLMSFLMLIGGSSGSTAGGIKTTTIAVLVLFSYNSICHNQHTTVFRRSLDDECLKKAVSVFSLNILLAFVGAFFISALNSFPLVDITYETFSAIGTVGLTTGITNQLSTLSWYILIFLMYCGRVGSVGFAGALLEKKAKPAVTYPVEHITIG
jgi:trk system potassium uptake protein TrkH